MKELLLLWSFSNFFGYVLLVAMGASLFMMMMMQLPHTTN